MPSLLDHFSPVISDALGLAAALSTGDAPLEDLASVRARLIAGMRTAQTTARRAVYADGDLQLASQSIVAWIDEIMQGHPDRGMTLPKLADEFPGAAMTEDAFFDRLEELGSDQDEVREIYVLLLCLGFQGRYRGRADGDQELRRLTDRHSQLLQITPSTLADLAGERLTAQPYSVKPPPPMQPYEPRPRPQPRPPSTPVTSDPKQDPARHTFKPSFLREEPKTEKRWQPGLMQGRRFGLVVGLMLIPLALLLAGGYLLLPWWLRQEVDERLATFECARLEASVGSDRVVRLDGYVASETDKKALLTGLTQTFGIVDVKGEVAVYPWPFCEVLEIVKPHFDQNIANSLNLALGVDAPNNVLKEGSPLVLTIRAPTYPAYLYVDYFQQNGDVGHVAHADANEAPDDAKDAFDYPTGYEGSPPYGLELLTIFASPTPLFEAKRPAFEKASTYLPALRKRLDELAKGPDRKSIAGSLVFVRTVP